MIEDILYNYLTDKGILIFSAYPAKRPKTAFVVMQKMDGARIDHIDKATFAFTSYGADPSDAACMNEAVKEALFDIIELSQVSRSELGGESSDADGTNHLFTYESIFNFTYYGGN